ncbi:9250_t:CDS:2, partial [Cetraspora pellucida]
TILPPVNWFPLLVRFNEPTYMKFDLRFQIVIMAIRHCSRSISLMEFLVHTLIEFPIICSDGNVDIKFKTLLICEGLGKILELCGFEKVTNEAEDKQSTQIRGVESIAKKVVVPNLRVLDIVDKMTSYLFGNSVSPENEELQVIFLTTMNGYISVVNTKDAPSVGALVSLQQELISLLKVIYYELPTPLTEKQAQIIRLAAQSCVFAIEDIEDNLIKSTVTICTMSELG